MPTSTGSTTLTTSSLSVNKSKGFTLIELLVAISIIAILSVVGFVSYQNVSSKAKDARMKADIDAIKKAYESNYDPSANNGQGGYKALSDSQFASGKKPTPPGGGEYLMVTQKANQTDIDISGFAVCPPDVSNASSDSKCAKSNQGVEWTSDSLGICGNLIKQSTYNSTEITGWNLYEEAKIEISNFSEGGANVLKFYSGTNGNNDTRVWAAPGAQIEEGEFKNGNTYRISFNYTATADFKLKSRDMEFATVLDTNGSVKDYSYDFKNEFPGGCGENKNQCFLLISLPTPGMEVKIQYLTIYDLTSDINC